MPYTSGLMFYHSFLDSLQYNIKYIRCPGHVVLALSWDHIMFSRMIIKAMMHCVKCAVLKTFVQLTENLLITLINVLAS